MWMTPAIVVTSLFLSDATSLFQDPTEPGRRGRTAAPTGRAEPEAPIATTRDRRGVPSGALVSIETHVFRLKNGEPHSLADLVQAACEIVAIPDERTNSVICSGSAGAVERAVDLLQQLDQPADAAGPQPDLRMVPIRHREMRDVARQLMDAFRRTSLTVSTDRGRSTIVLAGSSDLVAKAMAVIELLDTPSNSATLEFAFFKASLNGDGENPAVPGDLEPVVAELRRFGHIELLGRASTRAMERDDFKVSGNLASGLEIEVGGQILGASEDGSVNVHLGATLRVSRPAEPQAGEDGKAARSLRRTGFTLETTVTTARGDYVVLGSAPSGWEAGESAILVLQVLP